MTGAPARFGSVDEAEVREVLHNLRWLDRCVCGQLDLSEFFVAAGHVLSERARALSRTCPARRQEVIFAYGRDLRWGYFGALSPGQRATMTLEEALAFVEADTADALAERAAARN